MSSRLRATFALLLLASFLVRAYEPLSKPHLWLKRSDAFASALRAGRWGGTYQQYHPGVTTMVVGSIALAVFDSLQGTPAEGVFRWAAPSHATAHGRRIAAGVFVIALVDTALFAAILWLLVALGGPPLAFGAGGLLAFSPPVLAEQRVFHPDAFLGSFMILSALLLIRGLEESRPRMLPLSGFVAGLAFLTKTPALFLIPFLAATLFVHGAPRLRQAWSGPREGRSRRLADTAWSELVRPALVWGIAAGIPFLLWPALWVAPRRTLGAVYSGLKGAVIQEHERTMFFLGETYTSRPPLLFYPVFLFLRSTFVTVTLALAAFVPYLARVRRQRLPLAPGPFWLLVLFVVAFTGQMMLSSKQPGGRYLHPANLGFEILAGVGLAWLAQALGRRAGARTALAAVLGGVALQAVVSLPYAPDYGAHHNQLFGGNPVAVKLVPVANRNEGIIAMSRHLHDLAPPGTLRLATVGRESRHLRQYLEGEIQDRMPADADYYLFDRGSVQRLLNEEAWKEAWEEKQAVRPAAVVLIDRVAYLWLYHAEGEAHETTVIRRGWEGMGPVPWMWTLLVAAAAVTVLRNETPELPRGVE